MSIYHKESPHYLDRAISSLLKQTKPPSEIVIVLDGPVGPDLENVLARYFSASCIQIKPVHLKKNMGLGIALREGLDACVFPIVARMDADDVALPDRFEKQLAFLEAHPDIDLVGGWIGEFSRNEKSYDTIRKVPDSMEEIVRFAKYRNPINHMTVMFRKKSVQRAGGYRHFPGFEDYGLWVRMIRNGAYLANLPEVLVAARTGDAMIRRRRGWEYARREWRFQRWMKEVGFLSSVEMYRNLSLRVPPRLLPGSLVQRVYSALRK